MSSPQLIVVTRWTWKQYTTLVLAMVLIILLFTATGYFMGDKDGIQLRVENNQLTDSVNNLTSQLKVAKRNLVMLKQISKVDRAANLYTGNSMDTQHQQIRKLERELKFFRSIMAPEESIKGLQISRFNWQSQENKTFSWQLSLIQAGSQGGSLSGYVNVDIIAMRGSEQVVIHLLTEKKNERLNYRFRYFQHLTGNITIT